jgi:hypothetical protein
MEMVKLFQNQNLSFSEIKNTTALQKKKNRRWSYLAICLTIEFYLPLCDAPAFLPSIEF